MIERVAPVVLIEEMNELIAVAWVELVVDVEAVVPLELVEEAIAVVEAVVNVKMG